MASLTLSTDSVPQFRYDSTSQTYEIKAPGYDWETLVTQDGTLPEWNRSMTTETPGVAYLGLNFERTADQPDPYPASTLGYYFTNLGAKQGWVAVGIPTPADSLPLIGTASYNGMIRGSSDVMVIDDWGVPGPSGVAGSVMLNFNFGSATLSGSLSPVLFDGTTGGLNLGTFNFINTIYSSGHYQGSFDTPASGVNGFYGQLTGSAAQELIGAWALPFHYSADDKDHQAAGAWIAKQ